MGKLVLPNSFGFQPQYPAPLDQSKLLAKDFTVFINFAVPGYNAATGKTLSISTAGSGVTQRATDKGISLYTPNGAWADIAVGEDWVGPNTLIGILRLNSIDSPYGGLFSKDIFAGTTQFAVGRDNTTSSLYGAVENGTAVSFGGASIPALSSVSVVAFTHSGVASTPMSYYRNGLLVGSTTALGTQNSGTGVLGLGRSRDASASFDSDVDWLAFGRAKRVFSAAEIASLATPESLWALQKAPARRLWGVSAAIGTVPLVGQALTSAQGGLSPASAIPLAGQSLTSARGVLGPSTSKALSGQSAATARGNLSPATSVSLSGQGVTSAQGSVSVSNGVTVPLSGQPITSAQGTIAPLAVSNVALSGQGVTSSQGALGSSTDKALSGQYLTSNQGSVGISVTVPLTGQPSSLLTGLLGVAGDVSVSLTGVGITLSQGGLSAPSNQQGGHYGGATLDRKRKIERDLSNKDRDELRKSLIEQLEGKVEELKQEVAQPEVPQEIKAQASKIIQEYTHPSIDLNAISKDISRVKALIREYELAAKRQRDQDEDEELLFMLL